jgi:hypothetical protein
MTNAKHEENMKAQPNSQPQERETSKQSKGPSVEELASLEEMDNFLPDGQIEPDFNLLENLRKERDISVAKVYPTKALEQFHSRVVNGKAKPNQILTGYLMKGLEVAWLNAVAVPETDAVEVSEWNDELRFIKYSPHPFIVDPKGILKLTELYGRFVDNIEVPELPDTKEGKENIIKFVEICEREISGSEQIKLSEQLKTQFEDFELINEMFIGAEGLAKTSTAELNTREKFVLLAFPQFRTDFWEHEENVWYFKWNQKFLLVAVPATTKVVPRRPSFLRIDARCQDPVEAAWEDLPKGSDLYNRFHMSPFIPIKDTEEG